MPETNDRIHPARQVIMRLPDTDPTKDPWSGTPLESGRNLDDDTPLDENVAVLPPKGKTPAQIEAELTEPVAVDDLEDEDDPAEAERTWRQFTLADILVFMTAVGIALGGVRFVPTGIFALFAGVVTLLFLVLVGDRQISPRRFRNIVVGLVTFYVVATIATIVHTIWAA
mgnify:CR=1 FL=1